MPELVHQPKNPTWPPLGASSNRVTRHVVAFTPARPGRNEQHGPTESFGDICEQHDIPFAQLIEFNFGLVEGEDFYFEKINWYLKNKLGCTKTTEKGNFIFSGGEVIYVPAATIVFGEARPIIVARRPVGAIRWILFAKSTDGQDPSYMIPGVDRTSEAPGSALPGNTGIRADQAEAIAALVQFIASTATGFLSDLAVEHRLVRLEASFFQGGEGIGDGLQPRGPHEGVMVLVRRTKNVTEDFPQLPFGKPDIIGYGNTRDAGKIIDAYLRPQAFIVPPPKGYVFVDEYYWGTRVGPTR